MAGQDECKQSEPRVQAEVSNFGDSLAVGRTFGRCGLGSRCDLGCWSICLEGGEDMSRSHGGRILVTGWGLRNGEVDRTT